MSLDESDAAVPDGEDGSFLDEFGVVALEEGVDGGGLIGDHCAHEGAQAVVALGFLEADNLHEDVVAAAAVGQSAHLHEHGLGQFGHQVEINYAVEKHLLFKYCRGGTATRRQEGVGWVGVRGVGGEQEEAFLRGCGDFLGKYYNLAGGGSGEAARI